MTIATMVLLLLTPSPTEAFAIVPMDTKPYHARPEYGVIFRPTADKFLPSDSYTSIFFNVKFPTIPSKPDLPSFIHNKCMQDAETQHIMPTSHQIRKHLFMEQDSDEHFIQFLPMDAMATSNYQHTNAAMPSFDWFPSEEDLEEMMRRRPTRETKDKSNIPLLAGKLKFIFRRQALQRAETEMHTKRLAECTELVQTLNQSLIRIDTITDDNYVIHEGLQHILQSNSIKKTHVTAAKHKRALLGFLMPAFTELLGIGSHENIVALQQNLQKLQDNQFYLSNSTTKIYEDLATLSNITSRRIDILWDELASQSSTMDDTLKHLNELSQNLTRYLRDEAESNRKLHTWASYSRSIHEHTNLLLMDTMMIQSKLSTWTRSLNRLINGFLPEELVGATSLKNALTQARAHLQRTRPAFNVIHKESNLAFYYSERLARVFINYVNRQEVNLFIHLKIPVSSLNNRLDIYQVLVNPVPLHSNNSEPQMGYMQLENVAEYFLQSRDNKLYAELTLHDYQYCKSMEQSSCSALTLNHDKTEQSCLASLFANDVVAIKSLCKFHYYPLADPPSYTVFIADGVYLMATKGANINIQCPGHVQQTQPAYYAIIQIPCACSLAGDGIYLPPSLANCDIPGTDFKISYPLNKIQAALFDFDMIPRPSDENIPLFQTPTLLSYLDESTGLRSKDEALQVDLQNQKIGYYNHMQDIKQITSIKTGGWQLKQYIDIAVYATELTVIIVIIFLVYFVFKHHKAISILTATATLPTAQATFILRASTIAPTSTPMTVIHSNPEVLPWIQLFVAYILVASAIHLIMSLYKMYTTTFRPPPVATTTVDLVISNCKVTKLINMASIPICGQHIHAPNLPRLTASDIAIRSFWRTHVTLEWSHALTIEALHMTQDYELPSRIRIPPALGQDLVNSQHMDLLYEEERQSAIVFITIHCTCGCHTSKRGELQIHTMNNSNE